MFRYNGLLFASFNLAVRNSTDKVVLIEAALGAIAALVSCVLLLSIMIFELGKPENYLCSGNDFNATFDSVWKRTTFLEISMGLSLLATGLALLLSLKFLDSLL